MTFLFEKIIYVTEKDKGNCEITPLFLFFPPDSNILVPLEVLEQFPRGFGVLGLGKEGMRLFLAKTDRYKYNYSSSSSIIPSSSSSTVSLDLPLIRLLLICSKTCTVHSPVPVSSLDLQVPFGKNSHSKNFLICLRRALRRKPSGLTSRRIRES